MKQSKRILGGAAVVLLVLALAPGVLAQGPTPPPPDGGVTDDEVNAIAKQLFCPVCENVPLDVCPTQACADWRDEIRTMLQDNRSEDEIKAYFVDRYGRRVLATPEASGIDLGLYGLLMIGVLVGAVVLLTVVRTMVLDVVQAVVAPDVDVTYEDLDPEYVARLEAEFQEFTRS